MRELGSQMPIASALFSSSLGEVRLTQKAFASAEVPLLVHAYVLKASSEEERVERQTLNGTGQ